MVGHNVGLLSISFVSYPIESPAFHSGGLPTVYEFMNPEPEMVTWYGAQGLGFRVLVWGLGLGVLALGFGVWGLGFGVWCLVFGVWGLGFGV